MQMHDTLAAVTKALRLLLTQLVTGASGNSLEEAMDIDDRDGFGPIRVTNDQSLSLGTRSCNEKRATLRLMQLCVGFIACGAYLQSPSSEPSQDKELTQLLLDNADLHYRQFNLLCPVFLDRVRQGVLRLPWKSANAFFNKFGSMLGQYAFARNEALSVLIIDLLTSVLGVWRSSDTQAPEVHKKFRSLCRWLSEKYVTSKMRAWTVRDRWARFLDHYLSEDPTEHSWFPQDEETSETLEDYQTLLPSSLLQRMNADSDLRVRFRVSRISARLISLCRHVDKTPLEVYMSIQKYLTGDVAKYVANLLCLFHY